MGYDRFSWCRLSRQHRASGQRYARTLSRHGEGYLKKEGFRDVHIGNAQAWYYSEDSIIVLWERFLYSFLRDLPLRKDTNMMLLWTSFEQWLLNRYPEAERIATPWADPMGEGPGVRVLLHCWLEDHQEQDDHWQ